MMRCYLKTIGKVKAEGVIFKQNLICYTIMKYQFFIMKLIRINICIDFI